MEKTTYKNIFIVLTFRNKEDVVDLLDSIKEKVDDYRVIIVNSFFDSQSDKDFEAIARENDCDFLSVENKGYGYGNNRGIEYALEHYEFQRLVISNPDIVLKKYDEKALSSVDDGLIGGKIINARGKKQNPLRVYDTTITNNAAYYYYCKKNTVLFGLGVVLAKIARFIVVTFNKKGARRVYAVHGSFLVIPRSVLERTGLIFDENLFMFCEELDLAARLKKIGIPTYYVPQIEVIHKEDGSIKLSDIDVKEKMKYACCYVHEKHKKRGF